MRALARLIDELSEESVALVFRHSSWARDRALSYERPEFLGDRVLDLAIARALYDRYPEFNEGRLAKIRSHVVSRQSCAAVARELDLGKRLSTAGSVIAADELDRIVASRNVLAALLEAALGALFLERGYEPIEDAIVEAFAEQLEFALTNHVDFKTELQEALARAGRQVSYAVLDVEGPPHDRRFVCAAQIDGEQVGVGHGRSKKAAEQEAARQVLESLGDEPVQAA